MTASAMPARRRHEAALALIVIIGLALMVPGVRWIESHRPAFKPLDGPPALTPAVVRRLALGFNGLVADWYWLQALQYIGRKIEESAAGDAAAHGQLHRIRVVDPAVLTRLFDMTTALDPRFTAVYEFAAVVLPAVDVEAAITLVERGVRDNPTEWYLHQQLAYIHWQRGDYPRAAEAFRRGARLADKPWMEQMAATMEAKGADAIVARQMYGRMYEETKDEQVKQWAADRLGEVRVREERDALTKVLMAWYARAGRCPWGWGEVAADVRAAGFRTDAKGAPLAGPGVTYVMIIGQDQCEVAQP